MIPDMIQKSQTTCKNKYNALNYSQSIEYKNRLTEIKQKTQQTNKIWCTLLFTNR